MTKILVSFLLKEKNKYNVIGKIIIKSKISSTHSININNCAIRRATRSLLSKEGVGFVEQERSRETSERNLKTQAHQSFRRGD